MVPCHPLCQPFPFSLWLPHFLHLTAPFLPPWRPLLLPFETTYLSFSSWGIIVIITFPLPLISCTLWLSPSSSFIGHFEVPSVDFSCPHLFSGLYLSTYLNGFITFSCSFVLRCSILFCSPFLSLSFLSPHPLHLPYQFKSKFGCNLIEFNPNRSSI